MENFINALNGIIWSPLLVGLCLCAGLFFSIRSRFVQLRLIPEMWHLIFQKKEDEIGLSSFQALALTLAGRVGTGNIAGVATAICFGGPGALFWMWMVAFLGASSAFVESTLGQIYKEKTGDQYRGGPSYYIEKGLNCKVYAWAFAIVTILASVFFCPGVQSNTIAAAWVQAFDLEPTISAAIITSILCFIIFGGLKRIAQFTSIVVPFMAQAYIVVAVIIVGVNYQQIPEVFTTIFSSAFGADSIFGGMIGAAISWGVKRGIYSNEAGQGTAPHASSAAAVSHPVKQGLVQAFSVYIDTLFVCSATGFMVLMTDCYNVVTPDGTFLHEGLKGVEAGPVYTQMAIDQLMPGWGGPFIAIAIFFFAFTTILGYYYMAETCTAYINRTLKKPVLMLLVKIIFLITVAFGTLRASSLIWSMADVGVGMMAYLNLIAILLLQGPAFKALKDYEKQMNTGINPVFHPESLGIKNADYWVGSRAERNQVIEEEQGVDNLDGITRPHK
ncbi:sodium:alanine symporter family protein [Sutterella sp.]|uniref:alanine/glycine:cation symporter family protein n=1 Tax=Sutterella sp. TaxID=1981025 RepID=UPI0026DFF7F4|nr:alanine/glycine:cation symporter family protein [Sutterella sp.]MDO5531926.1 alanine/glycine:cation symporter family protein [Sutterella sp.]